MLLKDKIAVITGTASGIGRASAILFARHGAKVICIDIDDQQGQAVVEQIRAENGDAVYYHADITSSGQVQAVVRECEKTLPRVDILFNNVGRTLKQTFEATTEEGWAQMLDVNLTGGFLCAKYFLPLMKKAGSGSIINHASVDSIVGNPSIVTYTAAKGAWIPLTHVMAHDLGKYNIRVNAISSGGIKTAMTARHGAANQSRVDVTPLARQGEPEEVAHVALFFASEWSSFVNGANLVVDGGRTDITPGCYNA